jgi:hypothetical protein
VDFLDRRTPSLLVERSTFDRKVAAMAARSPGTRLRPHVKAFKSTALAKRYAANGHTGFCCATLPAEDPLSQGTDRQILGPAHRTESESFGVTLTRIRRCHRTRGAIARRSALQRRLSGTPAGPAAPHVRDRGVGEERPTTKHSPNFALTSRAPQIRRHVERGGDALDRFDA